MATVQRYDVSDGTRWEVRYRLDGKQSRKRGFKRKIDAERWLAKTISDHSQGKFISPSQTRVTISELASDWITTQRATLKPSSFRPVESSWRIHVEPRWGRARPSKIDGNSIQKWLDEMTTTGMSPTTVKRAHGVLAGILERAVQGRHITRNPARGLRLPKKQINRDHVYLTHEQVEAFANAAGEHRVLVLTLAYTGLRWAEMAALRVMDVDLDRRRLNIVRSAVQISTRFEVSTTKGGEARSVPIPEFLADELRTVVEGKPGDELLFPDRQGGYMRRPYSSPSKRSWFKNAITASGVPTITPHSLRHTAASLAISAGANVKTLQRMLGHKQAAMTLDRYGHLLDTDLDVISDRLGKARERALSE